MQSPGHSGTTAGWEVLSPFSSPLIQSPLINLSAVTPSQLHHNASWTAAQMDGSME